MEDFTEMLALLELERYTIDQAVWIACDMAPSTSVEELLSRPTLRHQIAEKRIRSEIPVEKGGIRLLANSRYPPVYAFYDAVNRDDLILWCRKVAPAFGQRFLAAVDSTGATNGFELVGDLKRDRIAAWRKLCRDTPDARTKAWTNEQRFNELKRRHAHLFNIGPEHFIHEVWPELTEALPMIK